LACIICPKLQICSVFFFFQFEKSTILFNFEAILLNKMIKIATLGNGCFWCTETIYRRLRGVLSVTPGYSGGTIKNPSYREVCSGSTGHAECVQVEYDKTQIDFSSLLEIFFYTHDPTTLNKQGSDVGSQYRSAIFYHDEQQFAIAQDIIESKATAFDHPIVTELTPFSVFYKAEMEHHDYYNLNPSQPYCRAVISPKVKKLITSHIQLLKEEL
jgi:peptide-methionine (S)-S-oxide reductase